MKHLILLLFVTLVGYGQGLNVDEDAILKMELIQFRGTSPNQAYTKSIIGDSIIVSKKILSFFNSISEMKRISISGKYLTQAEAEDVFGKEYVQLSAANEYWTQEQLPDLEIVLFDENKYTSAVTIKKSDKIGLGTFSILSISKPLISRDGRYAIIETADEHNGGVLSIYRKKGKGWSLYKKVQLYYI